MKQNKNTIVLSFLALFISSISIMGHSETNSEVFQSYEFSEAIESEITRLNRARTGQTVAEQIDEFEKMAFANINTVQKNGVPEEKIAALRLHLADQIKIYVALNDIDLIIDHRISTLQQTAANIRFFHLARRAARYVKNGTNPYFNAILYIPALALDISCTPLVAAVLLVDYIFDSTIY